MQRGSRRVLRSFAVRLLRSPSRFVLRHWIRHDEIVRVRQQLRYLALAQLLARAEERPLDLAVYELSLFSQNGEDGVIAEILRRLGSGGRYFVEVGASGNEANCLLLADAFGWGGLFVEADRSECESLAHRYAGRQQVRVVQEFVTRENFAESLRSNGVRNDFDLLSIDIDGNDYWIWDSIAGYAPRIVVIEYNAGLDPASQLVQPYQPQQAWDSTGFYGASLGALRHLAAKKGYRLVHAELTGTNAFFVRGDLVGQQFVREDDIAHRAANHFLYGLRYSGRERGRTYVDVGDKEGKP